MLQTVVKAVSELFWISKAGKKLLKKKQAVYQKNVGDIVSVFHISENDLAELQVSGMSRLLMENIITTMLHTCI